MCTAINSYAASANPENEIDTQAFVSEIVNAAQYDHFIMSKELHYYGLTAFYRAEQFDQDGAKGIFFKAARGPNPTHYYLIKTLLDCEKRTELSTLYVYGDDGKLIETGDDEKNTIEDDPLMQKICSLI
ncbi:hypothetical protein EC844_11715 [Acinetobacter calcoaceticus]|uniref:Uncharacterized protein n=1 Tax=Acinetobacter calcoaceticus TaxID=471 RepID=A0A4R1XLP8_ACICA|nr:hypothetical protein EC844_11715 [Acinetobacter calcoaceticus]